MKRREFLKALTALPIVGPVIAKAAKPKPEKIMTTARIDHPVNIFYRKQFLRRYANPTAQTTPLTEGEDVVYMSDPDPVIRWRKYSTPKANCTPVVRAYDGYMKVDDSWMSIK